MKKLLKILLVLVISLPAIIFGNAEKNKVYAKIIGDYSYELIDDESAIILNYSGSEKNLVIPKEIGGKTVKKIGYGAFAECKSIETLEVPDTVISIENYAFSQCSQLQTMNIPDSVVSLGQYAFAGCNSLESLVIPNGIKSISYGAFFDCINLKSVEIPEGIKTIGGMVFGNCKSLESIDFPSTLTSIGGNAFVHCTGLKSITLPEGVTVLGSGAFQGCLSLEEVQLPDTLISIGQSVFQDCISLKSIFLPESVTGLGYASFSGCSSLKNINIPSQVTRIGNATFSGCASLENIEIPDTIVSLGDNVFSGCVSLKNIDIPDSVTQIGNSTFSYCSNLETVKLPKKLGEISTSLFRYCDKLDTVVIPNGVSSIQDTAFADCLNLRSVIFPDTISSNGIGSRIFSNSPKVVASVIEDSEAHLYMRRNGYAFSLINTGLNLDKKELTLNVNDSRKYVVILTPYTIANNSQLTWVSSNPSVATVDENGVVTALTEGEATITVRNINGLTDTSKVTITNRHVPITGISLNKKELVMKKQTTSGLRASISPSDTTEDKSLTWMSSDNEIATVSSTGLITARNPGEAIITVKTSNGISSTCTVTVISEITSVALNLTAITLEEGKSQLLRATINPNDTTDSKELTWKSSNPSVATVDQNGEVRTVKKGIATITVETVNGKKAECKITVIPAVENIPIENVTLNKTELLIEEEQTEELVATINPVNTTDDKTLRWTSNNEAVAVVENGLVMAKGVGEATITVITSNGKTATCRVTVTKKAVPIESVILDKHQLILKVGKSETLVAQINPIDTTDDKTLSWIANNETVAVVENGLVTAKGVGETTITVTTSNGKQDVCTITVFDVDTSKLEALVSQASAIEDIYTKDTYAILEIALKNAESVLENQDASQVEVNQAIADLENAINGLIERASQDLLNELQTKLEECKNLENDYTSEEFLELKLVIEETERLLETEFTNISANDVNQLLTELEEQKNNLLLLAARKELNTLLINANELLNGDLSDYPEDSIISLRSAVAIAKNLIDIQSKDIQLIQEATRNLNSALLGMQKVNKSDLEKLISEVNSLDSNKYTEVSWNALQTKLQEAVIIFNEPNVSQDEVDRIYNELLSVVNDLVLKVNKSALLSVINFAENIVNNIDKYKPNTVIGINEILEEAKNINESNLATQDEIDEITSRLVVAVLSARLDPKKL